VLRRHNNRPLTVNEARPREEAPRGGGAAAARVAGYGGAQWRRYGGAGHGGGDYGAGGGAVAVTAAPDRDDALNPSPADSIDARRSPSGGSGGVCFDDESTLACRSDGVQFSKEYCHAPSRPLSWARQ